MSRLQNLLAVADVSQTSKVHLWSAALPTHALSIVIWPSEILEQ